MNSERAKASPLVNVVSFAGACLIAMLVAYVAAYAMLITVNDGLTVARF